MKSIKKYIIDFLEYCEIEKGLSPSTVRSYSQFLTSFSKWLSLVNLSSLTPSDLSQEHIWKYRLYLSRRKNASGSFLSRSTQSYYLIALRVLLAYFVEKDILSLPPDKIKLPKDSGDKNIIFLHLEDLEKLLLSPNGSSLKELRDRAILETFFSTGLRIGELVSLNVNDLGDIEDKKNLEITIRGKGGRVRTIYFSTRSLECLRKYLATRTDDDEALFIHYRPGHAKDSKRLTSRTIQRLVKYYSLKAGLPHSITPHVLRHSYATDLLNQGVDLRIIQEFLGHKNIMTTQVYTHITSKKLRDIHKKFHSGDKIKND